QVEVGRQVAAAEPMSVGKPGEDVRDMRDAEIPVDKVRRSERAEPTPARHVLHQRLVTELARHVAIGDACCFKRQANEFAASLDACPVPELIGHVAAAPASSGANARIAIAWTLLP